MSDRPFQVGDIVRLIDPRYPADLDLQLRGRVVKTEDAPQGQLAVVETPDVVYGVRGWWRPARSLELVRSAP